jgi:DNA-directed RNA polymerase subunit E"
MAKKLAGKITRILTDQQTSPLDPKEQLTESWYGRIYVNDPTTSQLAKKLTITKPGEYAIKVR